MLFLRVSKRSLVVDGWQRRNVLLRAHSGVGRCGGGSGGRGGDGDAGNGQDGCNGETHVYGFTGVESRVTWVLRWKYIAKAKQVNPERVMGWRNLLTVTRNLSSRAKEVCKWEAG